MAARTPSGNHDGAATLTFSFDFGPEGQRTFVCRVAFLVLMDEMKVAVSSLQQTYLKKSAADGVAARVKAERFDPTKIL